MRDHGLDPLGVPFAPVPLADAVGGAVAVGDEAAVGQLAGALLLGTAGRLRSPEGPQVLIEIGPQPQREALDEPGRLVATLVLGEALLGAAGARPDVYPGDPGIAS